ncbi:MAG: type II secretion system minor pseudopilin GspJ [Alphaproteobacteria bacterium]
MTAPVERGFTLLEMLVALFIFSLIAGAGAAVLSSGLRSKETLEARRSRFDDLALAHSILKSDFLHLVNRPMRLGRGRSDRIGFTGGDFGRDEPVLRFVRAGWTNPDFAEPRASLQSVEYHFDGAALTRKGYDRLDPAEETPARTRLVLSDVSSLAFTFYDNGMWAEQWFGGNNGSSRLPPLVALEMDVSGVGPVRFVFRTSEPVE